MADEAFALSPISARAAQPSEEDYDAISQAFMETSRGRWFLGEYAKRNRNADTSMVLEAVARLEENLAAQRQPEPVPDNGLKEALAAIRGAVDEARVAALDSLALEDKLAPVRKGSRIIREIAWRWREIGADGRICDLIDSQIGAIEEACGQIASIDPLTAFDVIERRLAELSGGEPLPASPLAAAEDIVPASHAASPAAADDMVAAVTESVETTAAEDFEATAKTSSVLAEEAIAEAKAVQTTAEIAAEVETALAMAETVDAMAETVDVTAEPLGLTAEADDDAILDMIAFEMAAEDPDEVADTGLDEAHVAEFALAGPVIAAPEPIAAAAEPQQVQASPHPSPEAAAEPSLGSSLIARGILNKPAATTEADPLAPIRRMSQAEKIAFFS